MRWVVAAALLFCPLARPAVSVAQTPPAATAPAPALGTPTRVSVRIHADDPVLDASLRQALEAELKRRPEYVVDDRAPLGALVVYANFDIHDRKNPKGVSIAIAMVSNAPTYFVAAKLLPDGPNQAKDLEVRTALTTMAQQVGFLRTLNTVHMDELNDAAMSETAESIIAMFIKQLPPNAGG